MISTPEILVVALVAVMLFGAKKVPELARSLGQGLRQLKDATNDIKREIQNTAEENSLKEDIKTFSDDVKNIKENIEESARPIKRDLGL